MCGGGGRGGGTQVIYVQQPAPPPPQVERAPTGGISSADSTGPVNQPMGGTGPTGAGETLLTKKKSLLGQ